MSKPAPGAGERPDSAPSTAVLERPIPPIGDPIDHEDDDDGQTGDFEGEEDDNGDGDELELIELVSDDDSPPEPAGDAATAAISEVKPRPRAFPKPKAGQRAAKPAGRPPRDPNDPYQPPIRGPKYSTYASDHTNANQRTSAALSYWKDLPDWAKSKLTAYIYREWPVLAIPETIAEAPMEGDKRESREYKYIEKIPGEEPMESAEDFLHRFGAGSYKLVLNQEDNRRPLLTLYVRNLGSNDLKSHPPTDRHTPKYVDMNRSENRAYIEFLRGRGELPSQLDNERNRADMAQVTAVTEVTRQSDKLVELAERAGRAEGKQEARAAAGPAPSDGVMLKEVIHSMQETHNRSMEVVLERVKALGENSKPQDFKSALLDVLELSERLNKRGAGESEGGSALKAVIQGLQDQIGRMQEARIASLERMVSEGSSRTAAGGLTEQIRALRELNEVVDGIRGPQPEARESLADAAVNLGGPSWLKDLGPIMQSVAVVAQAAFGAYSAYRGQPVPAAAPQPAPGQPPFPQSRPPQQPGAGFPGTPQAVVPYPPPAGLPAPMPMPMPGSVPLGPQPMELEALVDQIRTPLINHLLDAELEDRGGSFAEWFANGYGIDVYTQIKSLGADMVYSFLMSHPRLGPQLAANHPLLAPDLVQKFVVDFCGHDFEAAEEVGAS